MPYIAGLYKLTNLLGKKYLRNTKKKFTKSTKTIILSRPDKKFLDQILILNRKRKIIRKRKLTLNDRLLEETEDDRYFEIS